MSDDQLAVDRLKYALHLNPIHCSNVVICDVEYFMFACNFSTDTDEVTIHPAVQLSSYDGDWMEDDEFRKQTCMIILFRWLIGCEGDLYTDVEVINRTPISCNEMRMSTEPMSEERKQLLFNEYDDVLADAIDELVQYVNYDDVRGCLAMKRAPVTSLTHMRVNAKYNLNPRVLIDSITERIDVLRVFEVDELYDEL
jgi:hypothetical protein